MILMFEECDFYDDFEAICDPPDDWLALDPDDRLEMFVWFKAYDSSACWGPRDSDLKANGYEYDCLAWVEFGYMGHREYLMENVKARTREEAERLLQLAADALYGKE